MPPKKKNGSATREAKNYRHPSATSPLRPDVGTQAQFKKKKPPVTYRYDSSLSPALDWDGKNPAREQGEALLKAIIEAKSLDEAKAAANGLRAMSRPFLNWAGKAERLSFEVPTLPLFVHERLSTKAIIETLRGHKKYADQMALFADPGRPIADQVLRAYEHRDEWVNRMILGDSLVVTSSLLEYEGLGGQVQMVYMDPPYGISFGSNFQPFVRRRDVRHNDDEDMTREPEMVQAYRDTWELGLHSYLSYMRDRLLVAKQLLSESGSIFIQISDENLHHVRELLDEVFGSDNFISQIAFKTKMPLGTKLLANIYDHLLWYAKDREQMKYRPLYRPKAAGLDSLFDRIELLGGERRKAEEEDFDDEGNLITNGRLFRVIDLSSAGLTPTCVFDVDYDGRVFKPTAGRSWKTNRTGMERLLELRRVEPQGNGLGYVLYHDDFPYQALVNVWTDTRAASKRAYAVQTSDKVVERCVLMTTDPGDLVLDPTCGSGTTAFVAEKWGRRWITIDTSRVPLALARQRLLTATFEFYALLDEARGPAGGLVYSRRRNTRGEEVGGLVPYVTLGSVAQDEATGERVLFDRPDSRDGVTRVSGPFAVEATIPTPADWSATEAGQVEQQPEDSEQGVVRLLEVLRRTPVLRLPGNKTIQFRNVRPPAKTLCLSAEALVQNGEDKPVAFVFGPENGAISQNLVFEAAKEANAKNYSHLYIIGFGIQPPARELVEKCADVAGIPATYVEATRDLQMGDLLKNMRSSQIFSVCGLPEVKVHKRKDGKFQVELLGLDVLDPVTMEVDSRRGDDVPAWFLDTDYNDLSFHVTQAFFPRTSAWENLKKALKGDYDESVWDHLAGTMSAPFEGGDHGQVAVKVIDDRGNELLVVKKLSEAGR